MYRTDALRVFRYGSVIFREYFYVTRKALLLACYVMSVLVYKMQIRYEYIEILKADIPSNEQ
jgi:hypothetical protein